MDQSTKLFSILENFEFDSKPISCELFGNGHIHKTYEVFTENGGHYILQMVNSYVFRDIDTLMNNIFYVSSYLNSKGIESLEIIKTKENNLYIKDDDKIYRIYRFADNTISFEKVETDSPLIKEASEAYGDLHMNLADLDATVLGEVIPDFHNTPKRFENFLDALQVNFDKRKENCKEEIEKILGYKNYLNVVTEALDKKEIHTIVTHNDPKINNVLFDANTLKFRCIVDLDTVMPGSLLYDFGDALRSLFTGENECNKDLDTIQVDFELYKRYLSGYASKMKDVFTPKEIELLPFSIFLLAIELGIRFLEDYLRGDLYFHINNKDDNLTRARTQISLADKVMDNMYELKQITKDVIESL